MLPSIRRIGILTGGGDAPGLNAAIRSVVKTAILRYGWQVIGFEDGYEGAILGRARELGLADVRGLLVRGGTILGASNRADPFHFQHPQLGDSQPSDHSRTLLATLDRFGVDALVVLGGEGSLTIAHRLHQLGLRVVGVPKTIDNDIRGTTQSIGFDTAVTTATDAIDRLHTTAESHHRVMLVELMGRDAGWIALHAGVAGGADVILVPELPFALERIVEVVERRRSRGRHFTIVAVAEGARPAGGEAVFERTGPLPYQRKYGGIAVVLQQQLGTLLPNEVRAVVLGHLQRGGTPTPFDRALATALGAAAVDTLAAGDHGVMVAVREHPAGRATWGVVRVPLAEVAGGPRLVPLDHPLVHAALGMGISFAVPDEERIGG
ncbi:MAG: 6-phosphofructokinase [Thermomicrobium sp.]|nr:6-phosphofructokinase [Thermomicrobium sp.]MDW7982293.1 ATP-dependent 6-phosphofructokinase [Thermomicrobium sp.]